MERDEAETEVSTLIQQNGSAWLCRCLCNSDIYHNILRDIAEPHMRDVGLKLLKFEKIKREGRRAGESWEKREVFIWRRKSIIFLQGSQASSVRHSESSVKAKTLVIVRRTRLRQGPQDFGFLN
jgi:hypothetical protein